MFKTLKLYGSGKPKAALRGIFADGKETISNFSVAFRTKVCFNKKQQMEWNGEGRDCGMLKIAVVEDQQEVRDELCRFIRQYAAENSLQVEVLPVEDGAVIAEHYEPGYDIIFMDVEMPGLDGFGAAEKIRAVDADAVLVFVTNMAQYAIKGYEVDALDYVLKPVNYYQFCTKLSRAVQRVQRRRGGQVVLQLAGGGMQVLSTGDIYYLETHDRLLWYHTTKGEFSVRASLASAEKQLAQYHFSRCNQCYLVNLQYVKAVENDFVHVNTDHLEISRRQRVAFLTAVASYIGGVL